MLSLSIDSLLRFDVRKKIDVNCRIARRPSFFERNLTGGNRARRRAVKARLQPQAQKTKVNDKSSSRGVGKRPRGRES